MDKRIRKICRQLLFVFVLAAVLYLPLVPGIQARSLIKGDFIKTNENGFINPETGEPDPNNDRAWSMAWFKGKLYVGIHRNVLEIKTFQEYPPRLDPYPVPKPTTPFELDQRGEIWQYTPETGEWKRVFQSEIMPPPYMPTARIHGFRGMVVWTDPWTGEEALYASTHNNLGVPGRIFRTTDGEDWQRLHPRWPNWLPPPFDLDLLVSSYRSLTVFNGLLYTTPVATGGTAQESEVPMILECVGLDLVGDNDGEKKYIEFFPVSEKGFGDKDNLSIFELQVFNGYLYAGTLNPGSSGAPGGYQVWKSDCVGEPFAPYTWTQVIFNGAYRGKRNEVTVSMEVFQDCLYVGGGIQGGGSDLENDISGTAELIRIHPDDTWDLISGQPRNTPDGFKEPISGMLAGFSNVFTGYIWRMEVHEDTETGEPWLYVGTMDSSTVLPLVDLELLDAPDFIKDLINKFGPQKVALFQGGFDLWKTQDGVEWFHILQRGLDNPLNLGARSFQSTPFGLFLGTVNPFTVSDTLFPEPLYPDKELPGGCEVWLGKPEGRIGIDPRSLTPKPRSIIIEIHPLISAIILGESSDINVGSIELRLDGNLVPHSYEPGSQQVHYIPPVPLDTTSHSVELSLEDTSGRPVSASWQFTIRLAAEMAVTPSAWYMHWLDDTRGSVRCYIGNLAGGYDVTDINVSTVMMNGIVPAERSRIKDSQSGFSGPVLEVMFNRHDALMTALYSSLTLTDLDEVFDKYLTEVSVPYDDETLAELYWRIERVIANASPEVDKTVDVSFETTDGAKFKAIAIITVGTLE